MRSACDPTDDERREDLLVLRYRQTRLLLEQGLLRTGPDGKAVHLPVLAYPPRPSGDPGGQFLAIDGRLVVPIDQVERVRAALGDVTGEVIPLGSERFTALELRGVGVVEAIQRLQEEDPSLRVAPQHLLFHAFRGHGQEGEDPEPVSPLEVRTPVEVAPWHGEGVLVAIVDTGMAATALESSDPFLTGTSVERADLDPLRSRETRTAPDGSLYQDLAAGHGTMVAGVVREVAPGCELTIIRALDSDGIATDDEIAGAVDEAVSRGADIINLSLGGFSNDNDPPPLMEEALRRVPGHVIVVAAAGNFFSDRPCWPGAIRRVVSVAALDQTGNDDPDVNARLAWYSSFGWWVDVAAPGTWAAPFAVGWENPDRETDGQPDHFDGWAEAAGTSLAAAAITGSLAVELSRLRRAYQDGQDPAAVNARDAIVALLGRAGNVRMPQGTMAVDIWGDD